MVDRVSELTSLHSFMLISLSDSIITYVMLCGYSPFRSDDPEQLIKETSECKITFHERYWRNITPEAKSFISSLVCADPEVRLGAAEALQHPWLSSKPADEHDLSGLRDNFNPKSKWKSAINSAIAMGRMKRAGSDRSIRTHSRENSDISEDESLGWRTPNGKRTSFQQKGPRQSLNVGGDRPPAERKLSTDTGANENVTVHPPHEDLNSISEADSLAGRSLKREDEAEHPGAVHALPDEEVEAHAATAGKERKSHRVKDSIDMLRMPGSFDWSESQHDSQKDAASGHEAGQEGGHENALVHFFQRLGLHWHHHSHSHR